MLDLITYTLDIMLFNTNITGPMEITASNTMVSQAHNILGIKQFSNMLDIITNIHKQLEPEHAITQASDLETITMFIIATFKDTISASPSGEDELMN